MKGKGPQRQNSFEIRGFPSFEGTQQGRLGDMTKEYG